MSEMYPITMWYSTLGIGDGHDFATRGYLKSLIQAQYPGLRIPPSVSTSLLRFDKAGDSDISGFAELVRPPKELRMKPLVLVKAGDPRIGTKRLVPSHINGAPDLDKDGEPVMTEIEITEGSIDLDVEQEHVSAKVAETKCLVIHHDPASICRHYTNIVKHGRPSGVAFVGVTVWETSEIPEAIAMVLSELDLIIVPSEHAKKAFVDSGVSADVEVVPHAFDLEKWPKPSQDELALDSEREKFVFYSVATPIERKNLVGLMRGYFKAFEGHRDVVLRLKSSADKGMLAELAKQALDESGIDPEKRPSLNFFTGKWPVEKIRAFHLDGDCYVSATRGEGFGLCELEAKLCGSQVVTTSWGAAPEILEGLEGTQLVAAKEVSVFNMQGIGCYEPEQCWAEPLDESLAACMRAEYERGRSKDVESWNEMNQRFGEVVVGRQLAALLLKVQQTVQEEDDDL